MGNDNELRNRIVRVGVVRVGDWVHNPDNPRDHPIGQRRSVMDLVRTVGVVEPLLINLRTSPLWEEQQGRETGIDGHQRVEDTEREYGPDAEWPAVWVDLDPEEEAITLAALDQTGAMGWPNRERMDALLSRATTLILDRQSRATDVPARRLLHALRDRYVSELDEPTSTSASGAGAGAGVGHGLKRGADGELGGEGTIWIAIRVPMEVREAYDALMNRLPGDDWVERFERMVGIATMYMDGQ